MPHRDVSRLLDTAMAAFELGHPEIAVPMAFAGLNLARRALPAPTWRVTVEQVVASHPVRSVVLEDPMTRRALAKPRGYAGDAVLLDYMYRLHPHESDDATPRGREIHELLVGGPAPTAARHRLGVLADALRSVGARPGSPGRALAVASGHLRELALVPPDAWPSEVVALDQDADSLAVVATAHPDPRVVPLRATVRDLLARRVPLQPFDLVYSAGLFDYLDVSVAASLTGRLLDLVAPGGRLLLANFTPDTPDIGFMEAMLEWNLVYRTEADMEALLDGVSPRPSARTWRDPSGCIVYLDVVRDG